jgi:hypothetical protein
MANTYNSGVYPEEWATRLQERLDKPMNWKEMGDVIFSDTKIFNLPYMSTEFASQTGTRGTAYGFSDFTLTNDTIDIATKKLVPVFVDRADMAQMPLVNQMEIADRQAALLGDDIETAMLADHAEWTDFGDNAGSFETGTATQITVSATNIDDIVRSIRREVTSANGEDMANRFGLGFVWRPADFEKLEQFAQANGFNLADAALENGIDRGYYLLGAYHYVSNSHAANHVLAGVRKIIKIGILRTTWGQIVVTPDPNLQSGQGIIARADYDVMTPDGHATLVFDVNVA